MKTAGIRQLLVVRVLLGCILFSLFACGLHHGQMTAHGLAAALAGQSPPHVAHETATPNHDLHAGHSAHGDLAPALPDTPSPSGHDGHQLTPAFSCPLCSSFAASVAINSRGWSLPEPRVAARVRPFATAVSAIPPRHLRPTLNPRAPPLDFLPG